MNKTCPDCGKVHPRILAKCPQCGVRCMIGKVEVSPDFDTPMALVQANVAIMHYTHRHGTDTILFLTDKTTKEELPEITDDLLKSSVIELEEGEETFWVNVLPLGSLPSI